MDFLDKDGKLTEGGRQHVGDWLKQHGVVNERLCPMCNKPGWDLVDHIVQPVTTGVGAMLLLGGSVGYPQVMLISRGCGHTVFFIAVQMGLYPPASSAPEKEKKNGGE